MATICGCYYQVVSENSKSTRYLPQVDVVAHTTVLSTASSTVLTQTFVNPSSALPLPKCHYDFPLYDGVSVVGFSCEVGPRTINGVVKGKTEAKEVYENAIALGETAGLLEQGPTSDVFMNSLGNIPAGEKLTVKITYIGELKHDMASNGIRFTLPTFISPRYGDAQPDWNMPSISTGGISITVDISTPENSPIQEVRSPSHPIALSLGKTSVTASEQPSPNQASATLSLGISALDKDFVLEIVHQNSGKPQAVLENHAKMPGHRAVMVTLVPETVKSQGPNPELIIVADQSGSMQGARTRTLVSALRVLLKSLPIDIKFNICAFGSGHTLLWERSQKYGQDSLAEALAFIGGFSGSHGGTETLGAIKASIESRDLGENLSMILATDGDIWQQNELFHYLNKEVANSTKSIRVYPLGVGNSVSSALIEGIARAGNGFAQSVAEDEKVDTKVIRLLKGALIPDNGSCTMEIQYHKDNDEDEYEFVERVTDSLRVVSIDEDESPDAQLDQELAASAMVVDHEDIGTQMSDNNTERQVSRDQGPTIPMPKLLQTPLVIPPLYPHSRTTVYVLLSPDALQNPPKSVILRGTSPSNLFSTEIPISISPHPGTTLHSLAAKRAILELEEGRGWLHSAKLPTGSPLSSIRPAQFSALVKAEAVRLGVEYQIASKYTSFVAVETSATSATTTHPVSIRRPPSPLETDFSAAIQFYQAASPEAPQKRRASAAARKCMPAPSAAPTPVYPRAADVNMDIDTSAEPSARRSKRSIVPSKLKNLLPNKRVSSPSNAINSLRYSSSAYTPSNPEHVNPESEEPLHALISLQSFAGYWKLTPALLDAVGVPATTKTPEGCAESVWATMLVISWLEKCQAEEKEVWEMVAEKGKGWLEGESASEKKGKVDMWWKEAGTLVVGE